MFSSIPEEQREESIERLCDGDFATVQIGRVGPGLRVVMREWYSLESVLGE